MKGGGDIYDCMIQMFKTGYSTKALRPVRRNKTEGFSYFQIKIQGGNLLWHFSTAQ